MMKYLYLILTLLIISSCKKEEVYGPFKLKNGQEVELLIKHSYGAEDDQPIILPQNQPAGSYLSGLENRKPGYNYRVKATFVHDSNPPPDAGDRYFNFKQILSEEKYQGNETFYIRLIHSPVPGVPFIMLQKSGDQFIYIEDKLQLNYADETVKSQLEEIWQNALAIRQSYQDTKVIVPIKWKAIRAKVSHDPNNFGKAYLISKIEFTN